MKDALVNDIFDHIKNGRSKGSCLRCLFFCLMETEAPIVLTVSFHPRIQGNFFSRRPDSVSVQNVYTKIITSLDRWHASIWYVKDHSYVFYLLLKATMFLEVYKATGQYFDLLLPTLKAACSIYPNNIIRNTKGKQALDCRPALKYYMFFYIHVRKEAYWETSDVRLLLTNV